MRLIRIQTIKYVSTCPRDYMSVDVNVCVECEHFLGFTDEGNDVKCRWDEQFGKLKSIEIKNEPDFYNTCGFCGEPQEEVWCCEDCWVRSKEKMAERLKSINKYITGVIESKESKDNYFSCLMTIKASIKEILKNIL